MTRLHYICVAILLVSSLLFLGTYQHQATRKVEDLSFAKVVTSITDSAIPDVSKNRTDRHELVADRGAITESRAISIFVLFCLALLILVIFLVQRERKTSGKRDFQMPLTAVSIMLCITFISMAVNSGIF